MNPPLRWYHWIDILSLNISAGAVISAAYFAKLNSVQVNPYTYLILALAVWIIYTADHLKDATGINREASTIRHKFHQRNYKYLFSSIIIVGLIILLLLFNLDKFTILWGLKLSALVILYLVINHYLSFTKELFGGLLYCFGILLPSLSQIEETSIVIGRYEVLIFSLIVIINLYLFSANEIAEDIQDNHRSFASKFGQSTTLIVVKSLIAITWIVLLLNYNKIEILSIIIFVLMLLMLIIILVFPNVFKKHDRYRYWGDIIFLFPMIYLLR